MATQMESSVTREATDKLRVERRDAAFLFFLRETDVFVGSCVVISDVVENIVVQPEHRRQGYGQEMLAFAVELGARRALAASEEGAALLLACGWQPPKRGKWWRHVSDR